MDPESYIDVLERENRDLRSTRDSSEMAASNAMYNATQDSNLIVFQLELDNILERTEHLLKGDVLKVDTDGNVTYTAPKDKDLIVLNDYGVQLLMNVITNYLNRNTILSNHKEERIFEVLYDLGYELADLIYESYEKMGLDTPYKKARYIMIVLNLLHTIENAYNRSLHGGERDSLRSARVVTQNQPLGGGMTQNPLAQRKKKWYQFW